MSAAADGLRIEYSLRNPPYNAILECILVQNSLNHMDREEKTMKDLKEYVRTIPDYPEPGVMFRDVTSILQNADGRSACGEAQRRSVPPLCQPAVWKRWI